MVKRIEQEKIISFTLFARQTTGRGTHSFLVILVVCGENGLVFEAKKPADGC